MIEGIVNRYLSPLWHRREVGIGLSVFTTLSSFLLAYGDGSISLVDWIVSIGCGGLLLLVWWYTNKLPRCPKDKVGIAIAIHSDDDTEARQIEADLIRRLKALLVQGEEASLFHVIRVPKRYSEEIVDLKSAAKLQRRVRCRFLLFGQCVLRFHKGKQVHVLSLEASFATGPIPIPLSRVLSAEFRQALPQKVLLPREDEVIAFEATSAWLDVSTRFIVGIAAQSLGMLVYAERLLIQVEKQVREHHIDEVVRQPISKLLPQRMIALYAAMAASLYDQYLLSRDDQILARLEKVAGELLQRSPDDYRALQALAMSAFVLRHDLIAARKFIQRCRRIRDSAWRFSLAFLLAYEGDLDGAHDEYRRAFRADSGAQNVHIQTEDFINMILEREPQMQQLHFCLALINYTGKRDLASARREFDRFLTSPLASNYSDIADLSRELRAKCDSALAQA